MTDQEEQDNTKPIGQFMMVIAVVIGLGLFTLFFDNWEKHALNPNSNPESLVDSEGFKQVKLLRNKQGHYVVNGLINQQEVKFLLDTGATDVVIPAHIARKAGLIPGPLGHAATANGLIQVHTTHIHRLQIGNIVLHKVRASITTSMLGDTILLGMSALKRIEFVQQGSSLTLKQSPQ